MSWYCNMSLVGAWNHYSLALRCNIGRQYSFLMLPCQRRVRLLHVQLLGDRCCKNVDVDICTVLSVLVLSTSYVQIPDFSVGSVCQPCQNHVHVSSKLLLCVSRALPFAKSARREQTFSLFRDDPRYPESDHDF
jgi:hypothetical protein